MIGEAILGALESLGVTVVLQGDRLRYHPRSAVPPELTEDLRRHREDVIRILSDRATVTEVDKTAEIETSVTVTRSREFETQPDPYATIPPRWPRRWTDEELDAQWDQMEPADVAYARSKPSRRCLWCFHVEHTEGCITHDWEPVVPWGRFKGRKVSDCPADYLRWLVGRPGIDSDLREAARKRLKGGEA